jgi:hypothetical protein
MSRFDHLKNYSNEKLVECLNKEADQPHVLSGSKWAFTTKCFLILEERGIDISSFTGSQSGHRTFACRKMYLDGNVLIRGLKNE